MYRSAIAICIAIALASNATAQDFLLRLDTVVSEFASQPGVKPQAKTVRSIEAIAQPGGKFYAKTTVQGSTYVLSGRLRADPKGRLLAELKYRHAVAPVQMASTKTPVVSGSNISTTLLAVEGKSILVSGSVVNLNAKPAQLKEDLYFTITKFNDRDLWASNLQSPFALRNERN